MPEITFVDNSRALRQEVTRLAKVANKRLKRLRLAEYEDSPAFTAWERGGGVAFGVKGKSNQQVQAEYRRVKQFLSDRTSTIRGANNMLKEIRDAVGYSRRTPLRELKTKLKSFFRLAQRISEYNKLAGDAAKALDYQKIWSEIRQLEKDDKIRLDMNADADDYVDNVEKAMQAYIKEIQNTFSRFNGL